MRSTPFLREPITRSVRALVCRIESLNELKSMNVRYLCMPWCVSMCILNTHVIHPRNRDQSFPAFKNAMKTACLDARDFDTTACFQALRISAGMSWFSGLSNCLHHTHILQCVQCLGQTIIRKQKKHRTMSLRICA